MNIQNLIVYKTSVEVKLQPQCNIIIRRLEHRQMLNNVLLIYDFADYILALTTTMNPVDDRRQNITSEKQIATKCYIASHRKGVMNVKLNILVHKCNFTHD